MALGCWILRCASQIRHSSVSRLKKFNERLAPQLLHSRVSGGGLLCTITRFS